MDELNEDLKNGIDEFIRFYVPVGDIDNAKKKLQSLVKDAYVAGRMSAFIQMKAV